MAGTSSKTKVVGVRLPNEVEERVRENARRQKVTVSVYLGKLVTLQVMRKR